MASCDFSTSTYMYAEVENDFTLEYFNISMDFDYKIPFIRSALRKVESRSRETLYLFGSPWSAPAWMKDSNSVVGGKLKKEEKFQKAWSLYFSKFIQAYQDAGIPIWAVTTQNEPNSNPLGQAIWQDMEFTAEEQRDFVRDFLGPQLKV